MLYFNYNGYLQACRTEVLAPDGRGYRTAVERPGDTWAAGTVGAASAGAGVYHWDPSGGAPGGTVDLELCKM